MTAPAGTAANTPPGGALPVVEQAPPTEAEIAYARLSGRLTELADAGIDWPCRDSGDLWFADDVDERAAAAELCVTCPALAACARYADAADERHGVWAGKDRTPPRPRKENR